jgi:hypothetical protein
LLSAWSNAKFNSQTQQGNITMNALPQIKNLIEVSNTRAKPLLCGFDHSATLNHLSANGTIKPVYFVIGGKYHYANSSWAALQYMASIGHTEYCDIHEFN